MHDGISGEEGGLNPETSPEYGHACYHFDAGNYQHASVHSETFSTSEQD